MTIDLDINFLKYEPNLSIGQLLFLSLVKNDNQTNHQEVSQIVNLFVESEIQDLIDRGLLTVTVGRTKKVYKLTSKVISFIKNLPEVKSLFDEFYELYPSYITRVDGTKDYLRSNVKQARKYYESLVGSNETLHRHIIKCLKSEVSEKLITGKIGYMKRMWKWLTNHEWEIYEDRINEQTTHKQKEDLYGTEIL